MAAVSSPDRRAQTLLCLMWRRAPFRAPRPCRERHSPSLSLVDLGCEVELHVPVLRVLQGVLDEQRRVRAQAELHEATERRRLREVHQVPQREGRRNRLVHRQRDPVLRLLRLPRLQHDVARTQVALHAERDALLARLHLHRLAELLQVPADLLELRRGQLHRDLVVLLRNLHVLALDLHQLQVELGDAIVVAALALEAHCVGVRLPPQLQRIAWATHLQDLRQGVHVHAQGGGPVALELGERRLAQQQGDQRHVRAVHGLHLDAFLAAIEIHILAQVLHGVHHLLQQHRLLQMRLESHG
mmetsp:Transcript_83361/g.232039  ORF Transcript_83361/g.232039 Transcript_83361/m.232039 type:complete len:300 (-) Transcript_83361:30-929(-)